MKQLIITSFNFQMELLILQDLFFSGESVEYFSLRLNDIINKIHTFYRFLLNFFTFVLNFILSLNQNFPLFLWIKFKLTQLDYGKCDISRYFRNEVKWKVYLYVKKLPQLVVALEKILLGRQYHKNDYMGQSIQQ